MTISATDFWRPIAILLFGLLLGSGGWWAAMGDSPNVEQVKQIAKDEADKTHPEMKMAIEQNAATVEKFDKRLERVEIKQTAQGLDVMEIKGDVKLVLQQLRKINGE